MTAPLTFAPTYPGGRILLMMGQHQVGAVFPPPSPITLTPPDWRWMFWLTTNRTLAKEGRAKTEQAAKNAILAEARAWLQKAGVE